jgi:hypothetical protein
MVPGQPGEPRVLNYLNIPVAELPEHLSPGLADLFDHRHPARQ